MSFTQPEAVVGDKIKLITGSNAPSGEVFYNEGDTAVLVRQDMDGDWWADFSGQGNSFVSHKEVSCLQQSNGFDEGRFEVIRVIH
jgi:hypothetical protein